MSREVVMAVDVATDPHTTTQTLTTHDGLTSFWTPDVTAEPTEGADLRFGFAEAPVPLEVTLETLEPGARVVWSCQGPWPWWGGTTVEWRLGHVDGGTRVVLVHGGWADDYPDAEFGSVAYTWALVLGALQRFAETGTPAPALA